MIKKHIRSILFGSTLAMILVLVACYLVVDNVKPNTIYSDITQVPARRVGLLLGCSAKVQDGRDNLFFLYRVSAAYDLLAAKKIQYLIISGDNSTKGYDETTDMKNALIKRGIAESRLISDYAGFRTLDSVVRASKVFATNNLIIISQEFHNKRALYIAENKGISAIAFNAEEVGTYGSFKTKTREVLARVKTVLDIHVFNTQPKFLGEVIAIPTTV